MPNGPDKVILNHGGFIGRSKAIKEEFKVALQLGKEIVDNGWAKETNNFRDEMAVECSAIDKALDKYLDYLRKFNQQLAAFIDNHP